MTVAVHPLWADELGGRLATDSSTTGGASRSIISLSAVISSIFSITCQSRTIIQERKKERTNQSAHSAFAAIHIRGDGDEKVGEREVVFSW